MFTVCTPKPTHTNTYLHSFSTHSFTPSLLHSFSTHSHSTLFPFTFFSALFSACFSLALERAVERRPGCLALIVKVHKKKSKNFLIEPTADWGAFVLSGHRSAFRSLQDLLLYFSRRATSPLPVRLTDVSQQTGPRPRKSAATLSQAVPGMGGAHFGGNANNGWSNGGNHQMMQQQPMQMPMHQQPQHQQHQHQHQQQGVLAGVAGGWPSSSELATIEQLAAQGTPEAQLAARVCAVLRAVLLGLLLLCTCTHTIKGASGLTPLYCCPAAVFAWQAQLDLLRKRHAAQQARVDALQSAIAVSFHSICCRCLPLVVFTVCLCVCVCVCVCVCFNICCFYTAPRRQDVMLTPQMTRSLSTSLCSMCARAGIRILCSTCCPRAKARRTRHLLRSRAIPSLAC